MLAREERGCGTVACEVSVDDNGRRRRLREEIVHYVQLHPEVADTAVGITQWWLRGSRAEESVDLVEDVLDDLVGSGLLRRTVLPDGGVVYAAARPQGRPTRGG
jgi:hypothetical protein